MHKDVSEDAVTCSVCGETADTACAGVCMIAFNAIDECTCPTCLRKRYVSTMKETNDTIAALKSEVVERLGLTDLLRKHEVVATSAACNQWSKVVGKCVRNQ